jgi:uncharacterized membrane protein
VTRSIERATGKTGKVAKKTVGRVGKSATDTVGTAGKAVTDTPRDLQPLQQSVQHLAGTLTERAVAAVSDKVSGTAERLTDYAEGSGGGLLAALTGSKKLAEGKSPLSAAMSAGLTNVKDLAGKKFEDIKESFTGGKGKDKGGKKIKLTNIVEQIDVGVPVQLAYDQWTQFGEFPKFMKKVEQVEQKSDEKLAFTAKVFWSRRTWESTILEQVPEEHIIWRSKGDKGYIDGAVTFHELAPSLTRIILVLEYHPQGFFEKTGNLWRAQGRRARLELKHFQRHLMTQSALHPDDVEGWRGEIHDGEVEEPESEPEEPESEVEEPESEPEEPERQPAEDEDREHTKRQPRRRTGSARAKGEKRGSAS